MAVEQTYDISAGRTLHFIAENIRRERTGVHAKVSIAADKVLLAYSVFNVERSEERSRLAKRAYEGLTSNERNELAAGDLSHWLDLFCHDLWDTSIERFSAIRVSGAAGGVREWYCKPFVLKGGGTIMFGPPGKGKSWATMLLAISLEHGIATLFPVEAPCRVMYVNLERDPAGMATRLQQCNAALGLPDDADLLFFHGRGYSLQELRDSIEADIERHSIDVVLLDSISRAGSDLNNNQEVNRIVDTMNNLVPTWFAIAHTPRQDESHLYGSIHFEAGADVVVQMQSAWKPERIGVSLRVIKANDAPLGFANKFVLEFDEAGLSGLRGTEAKEFLMLGAPTLIPLDDAIIAHLHDHGEATAQQIADASGHPRGNVVKMLNAHREVFRISRRDGTKVYYGMAE